MKFENILNLNGKGLTGNELTESENHDVIVTVRAIEMHKEEIRSDPCVLFPVTDEKKLKHIYKHYCSTGLHNGLENLPMSIINQAIDLCYLY